MYHKQVPITDGTGRSAHLDHREHKSLQLRASSASMSPAVVVHSAEAVEVPAEQIDWRKQW